MFCVRQSSVRGCRFSFVFVYFVIKKLLNVRRFPPPSSRIYQLSYNYNLFDDLNLLSVPNMQKLKTGRGLKPFHGTVIHVCTKKYKYVNIRHFNNFFNLMTFSSFLRSY